MARARAAVVLAAGQGTRMKTRLPKVLHAVGGRAMLDWAIDCAQGLGCSRIVVVVGTHSPEVRAAVEARLGAEAIAVQAEPLGTAHAVRAAEAALADFEGDVVVSYADAPLLRPDAVAGLFTLGADVGVLGFEAANPTGYGRLITDADGGLSRIVEEKDASAEERAIRLCNSGVIAADRALLFALLAQVTNENAKGEYYLTDVVALARAAGRSVRLSRADETCVLGVNTLAELAAAEAVFQARARAQLLAAGVAMPAPETVHLAFDSEIAADVVVEPHVVFGPGVRIARGARIRSFSHLEGAEVGEGAVIGPFARLRPGTRIGLGVKIGNFVEVKNASFGERAQANHLSYIGDADVGARANLGAGTITCNYDGFDKHRTVIGAGAFIGSDTALVAPVRVGEGAYTGSGSVITTDVPDNALAVARGRQRAIEGWAEAFRARKRAERDKRGGKA